MSVIDQVKATPTCPVCSEPMVRRKSARGEFFGCSKFPSCRGTRPIDAAPETFHKADYEPIVKMSGSDEQEAIWKAMTKGKTHIVINAGPGVGKTFSMIQGCLRLPKKMQVRFMAFNRHIAKEANGKLGASECSNVEASTFHSFGRRTLVRKFKSLSEPNEGKMKEIFESISPEPVFNKAQWRRTLNLAQKLAVMCKNYLINYQSSSFRDEMERLADHHAIDFVTVNATYGGNGSMAGNIVEACQLIPHALDECKNRAAVSYDYDDMLWLPVVLDLPFEQSDILIVDESQDLNKLQHEITLRSGGSGRIVVVGDKHQSIYGFRGSHTSSMEVLTETLRNTDRGVMEFPLTITRRCPKLHVQMAQQLFPEIQALDDAPLGEILTMKTDKAEEELRPGDMVLCRVNKELIHTAYALIKRGIRPIIKGRDIGKGLLSLLDVLVKKVESQTDPHPNDQMKLIVDALHGYRYEQETKLLPLGDKAEGRIEALHEKCDCMMEFIRNSTTVAEMQQRIQSIFSDEEVPKNAVTLGTVHRTKGLEAERVFVLAPELIPHPAAKREWEREQEKNLAWVACTRAKFNNATGAPGTLVFCGPIPAIYGSGPEPPRVFAMGPVTTTEVVQQ